MKANRYVALLLVWSPTCWIQAATQYRYSPKMNTYSTTTTTKNTLGRALYNVYIETTKDGGTMGPHKSRKDMVGEYNRLQHDDDACMRRIRLSKSEYPHLISD